MHVVSQSDPKFPNQPSRLKNIIRHFFGFKYCTYKIRELALWK